MTRIHLSDPIPLAILPESILRQLPALTRAPDSHLSMLLREPGDAIAVVALGTAAVLGWMVADPVQSILGVYVVPVNRREGIGTALFDALWPAAVGVLPPESWVTVTKPGGAGSAFWKAMGERVAKGRAA